ncbi:glycosyltransferase family 2 protein [Putridiphycobacter roseus]|uniref:Glycosyltransferase family 2 protein n=1 Tax=Putridiphycobacter roseus TaxID=2219161 RepID=A0A2W1MZG7_9FLAO|nr:glycosyltransferase family 2 protein [Putridiphycobacter roseus]PZE17307.1 glycosyltransferase family 2 protein [Putridiphycobacter roseus]
MKNSPKIVVIIPAYNEEKSIGKVVAELPSEIVAEIIVCNNGSSDHTAAVAEKAGATVLTENQRGYGWACLKGMAYCETMEQKPDIVVFIDGDYSDYPQELKWVVQPIIEKDIDLVIGSRALGNKIKGSMTVPQVFGNWLATRLMRVFYGVKYSDLGPFRAIKYPELLALNMSDKTYGWTIEMQIKAAQHKMTYTEVPVNYKKRIGVSKVSGTVKGTILAGYKIIGAILKYKIKS